MAEHPFDAEAQPFVARALERLAAELGPEAITPAFSAAFRRWPRYRFVDRYTLAHRAWYDSSRGQALPHLQRLFGEQPICIKDMRWRDRFSVLSQLPAPSTAARFIQLLKLQPGHRVLEIGCGSGWLLALIAEIVGPQGKVIGIDIDADIAAQTRARLAALGVDNVEIHTGDAAIALPGPGSYDRIAISPGIQDLPRTVLAAAADDAVLVAPVRLPGASSARLYGWARHGNVFHASASVSCNTPPLLGRLAAEPGLPLRPDEVPFADLLGKEPRRRAPCFGPDAPFNQRFMVQLQFSGFVAVRFRRVYEWFDNDEATGTRHLFVGHYDRRTASAAILGDDGFTAYGPDAAWQQMQKAWNDWLELGRPGPGKYMLDIHAPDARPSPSSTCWVHQHRDSVFVWRLR